MYKLFIVFVFSLTTLVASEIDDRFEKLFNEKDFSGWYPDNPHSTRKAKTPTEIKQLREKNLVALNKHWSIKNGVIINDGHGPFLTTKKKYTDIEFIIECKLAPGADSGIYLRSSPQVQIWDHTDKNIWKHGSKKGSGGLWNNNKGSQGKDPLVLADNPIGEWNTYKIRQIGSITWVWLNNELVVDGAIMHNYWNRKIPLARDGQIHLQTHGAPVYWRNIYIREIKSEEANQILAQKAINNPSLKNPWLSLITKSLEGWAGDKSSYAMNNGVITGGGNLTYVKKSFGNFQLVLEFKLQPGGNSGIAIRYPGSGMSAYSGMTELQILDNTASNYAKLDPRQYHGSAYGMAAAHRGYLRPVGEWNFQLVTVTDSTIKVELNGVPILNADLSEVTNYLDNKPHPGKNRVQGFIGLSGHGKPYTSFRNLKINEL